MEDKAPEPKPGDIFKLLPSIDAILRSEASGRLLPQTGARHLTILARNAADSLREDLQERMAKGSGELGPESRESLLKEAEKRLEKIWRSEQNTSLKRVINATGVVIHTNLGRAPLSEAAREALFREATGFCNLEYNLETGKRGKRGAKAEHLLAELTGAESALIVNNCAAACVLVLTALAGGGEAIISRGEMVEIGGDFRVPDVMAQSGAGLVEVGTTNRTRVSDYERAIGPNTRLILKVHPSNYRIIGFTASPSIAELADAAHRNNILLYEDAGSGALFDMAKYGLEEEPVISRSIVAGADVVTFSADKLMGGVQAGMIVGRQSVVEVLRKHPLYRALRVNKLVYAALEATLDAFRRESVVEEVPVLRMLAMSPSEVKQRTWQFSGKLREKRGGREGLNFEVLEGNSVVGGGAAPSVQPKTSLLSLTHNELPAAKLEKKLRFSQPPVVARILENRVLLDFRTIFPKEEQELLEILSAL